MGKTKGPLGHVGDSRLDVREVEVSEGPDPERARGPDESQG